MKKIAIYGGAFDPIHNGHVRLAREFTARLALDRFLLIPTAQSPHKEGDAQASAEQRLEMCRLALRELPYVEVSDMEIRRGGKSYTVETLRAFKERDATSELYLIMGGDMFLTLDQWRGFEEILSLAIICPVKRDEGSLDLIHLKARQFEKLGARIRIEDIPPFACSSTKVRERIRTAKSVEGLIPARVELYIRQHRLYHS